MDNDKLIEEVCKVENPYEYSQGMWYEPLQGYLMTHETAEENSAHIAFEECRDLILLLLAGA
jgi:hypothetical protein